MVDGPLQLALGFDRLLLGALAILDIGAHAVPFDNRARFIASGYAVDKVPSILSVGPAQSHLGLERDARSKRFLPFRPDALRIVRVNEADALGLGNGYG